MKLKNPYKEKLRVAGVKPRDEWRQIDLICDERRCLYCGQYSISYNHVFVDELDADGNEIPRKPCDECDGFDYEFKSTYVDYVAREALTPEELELWNRTLDADEDLAYAVDKFIFYLSEYVNPKGGLIKSHGLESGSVDCLPARLKNRTFIFTRKATAQIGADNLQAIMEEAEARYDAMTDIGKHELEKHYLKIRSSLSRINGVNFKKLKEARANLSD